MMESPKVSGFAIIRNGTSFDYPFLEAFRSILPLVDELVINVGISSDDTLSVVQKFQKEEGPEKIKIFESHWPLDDPEKMKGGQILSEQTNLALDRCSHDWCFYIQSDEVVHEADYPFIREAFKKYSNDPKVEGLLFDYLHFYGSHDVIQETRSAYRREVRIIKKSSGARSVGDAQSFRKPNGDKIWVARLFSKIYHYGWVRPPEKMKEKTEFMDQLYSCDTGNNYQYKRFWGLKPFRASHPLPMQNRVKSQSWTWDLEQAPLIWTLKDLKKMVLDTIENLTGHRLFEYRSYRLLKGTKYSKLHPKASIMLATYNMPEHLRKVLGGIERQTYPHFEVVIADDGSGPKTKDVIEEFKIRTGQSVRHVWQEDDGFRKSKILNEAVRQSTGDLLIFLDGDCVPHKHFVKAHVENHEPGKYLCGRRVDLSEKFSATLSANDVRRGYFSFPRLRLLLDFIFGESRPFQRSFYIGLPWLRRKLGMDRIDDLLGSNYSVLKQAFIAINGYDENYEGYGREDTDVEIRLQNLGYQIKSVKGAALQFHLWHPRREFTPSNDTRLDELKKSGRVLAERGLTHSHF